MRAWAVLDEIRVVARTYDDQKHKRANNYRVGCMFGTVFRINNHKIATWHITAYQLAVTTCIALAMGTGTLIKSIK